MTFTVNGTYGSYNVTLTKDQMPAHSHGIREVSNGSLENYTHGPFMAKQSPQTVTWPDTNTPIAQNGGGKPHTNIQPSRGVYYWRRTG